MTFEKKLAKLFKLDDENWMRHANPMSVWTRYSVLPILIICFWSRYYIGWWCIIPVALSILWMFLNPIVFPKPSSTKNWASKSVLGERIYLQRDEIKIPDHHITPLYTILNTTSSIGMIISIYAIIYYSIWAALLGTALAYLGKSWFLDRMVWLYEDMKDTDSQFKNWEY